MAKRGMSSWSAGDSHESPPSTSSKQNEAVQRLAKAITGATFDAWYREREWAQNIRDGTAFFNGPSDPKPARRHSPSQLLQCSRKIYYRQLNAPAESGEQSGIYWFGSKLEEELVLDFLESVAGDGEYIANSLWVTFNENTDVGEIEVRGATDPVIVDRESAPLLLTEVKSKRTLENLLSPNQHHKAQAHAYMRGLTETHDRDISEAVIIYISRTTLDLQSFRIDFDHKFWQETVLDWIESHTTYRLNEELPGADPIFGWECQFCAYAERCGEGEKEFSDSPPEGLLPLFHYPRSQLEEYLTAHGGKLTPTLAHQYPDLADEYGVYDFHCRGCGSTNAWETIDWSGDVKSPPKCPACSANNSIRFLKGPTPDKQIPQEESDETKFGG